ncbi:hypothetical protein [Halocynthiibacter namhaensis]|uniref:hypothetical protein n=1 Tax=Halocynthiibacter namhaensis TaxID=1290553 RepID=UPI0012E046D5|nr:hypothetical protein [Halocynthiibacter namhaensis]
MNITKFTICGLIALLAGCTNPINHVPIEQPRLYSPPAASGLLSNKTFLSPNTICEPIGENELTVDYLDHTATLIGCPVHERMAIQDQLDAGAEKLDVVGQWLLLSLPD